MPRKKAKKTSKGNGEITKDKRIPPDRLLLGLLQKNKLVLIADEVSLVTNIIPKTIYVVDKRPRIRVFYEDQIEKLKIDEEKGEKVEIVN